MPVNRFLFLDLDGVVNSARYFADLKARMEAHKTTCGDKEERLRHQVDPDATFHLSEIVRRSGAKIVISSSWRLVQTLDAIKTALRDRGFEYASSVIGKTPYSAVGDSTNRRGIEIQNWLVAEENLSDEPRRIVILDDDRDMGPLLPHLVKTTWQDGLLAEHVPAALKILGVE